MSRTVYSALLAEATSVSGPTSLGGPPPGYLWVVRFACFTFGDYVGYINAALSVGGTDPWLWLIESGQTAVIGIHKQSKYWEGRMVVPEGTELYAQFDSGDTGDVYVSGYQLSTS